MSISEVLERAVELAQKKVNESKLIPPMSSLARCLRMSYYHTVEGDVSDAAIMGLDYHDFYGRKLAESLNELGWSCETEKKVAVESSIRVEGRIDIYCISQNTSMVIEMKFTSNPSPRNAFLEFYRRQLFYYMAASNADYGVLILFPFNGIGVHYKEIYTASDVDYGKVMEEMMERAKTYAASIASNTPPPQEKGPWCSICRFRQKCFNVKLA